MLVAGLALGALLAVAFVALGTGDVRIGPAGVLRALTGSGGAGDEFVVRTLRAPRLVTGAAVGASLAVAGGLFQCLVSNPLASPDVVGFTSGAATGALVQILLLGGGPLAVATGAVVGGCLTAVVVQVLAWRDRVGGYRLVLVGVGIGAALTAVNAYLVTRARLQDAASAAVWLTGSLADTGWDTVVPLLGCLAVLLPLAFAVARPLRPLALGPAAGAALGVRVRGARLAVVAVGVGLTAVATAAAGPVAFVALAAPQIALRLARRPGPLLGLSGLVGAVLLTGSDQLALRLPTGTLPVGVVTGALGGCYLAWLLAGKWRQGRA